ncbi:MAG: hypothetical protein DCF17_20530 [Shackletoniella antarctica]|uniref:Uncharacterized protein n=1 Tax=Shackletoniella antarctica TaxID=268115 RepID=A0A2W4VNE2_9CYAN|nr:MAG: hypothetical protein DCF17_20530 [Shackletoniella antarctica]
MGSWVPESAEFERRAIAAGFAIARQAVEPELLELWLPGLGLPGLPFEQRELRLRAIAEH